MTRTSQAARFTSVWLLILVIFPASPGAQQSAFNREDAGTETLALGAVSQEGCILRDNIETFDWSQFSNDREVEKCILELARHIGDIDRYTEWLRGQGFRTPSYGYATPRDGSLISGGHRPITLSWPPYGRFTAGRIAERILGTTYAVDARWLDQGTVHEIEIKRLTK